MFGLGKIRDRLKKDIKSVKSNGKIGFRYGKLELRLYFCHVKKSMKTVQVFVYYACQLFINYCILFVIIIKH